MARTKDRKVARAASIGGGVTSRGKTSTWWYMLLAVVVGVGVFLIVISRAPRISPSSRDHWHTALGLYICDKFAPDLAQPATLLGLHTHGEGLLHVEPYADADPSKSIGTRATLGRYIQGQEGFDVTRTSLTVPGEEPKKNGDLCGDKPGKVKIAIWETPNAKTSTEWKGDPKKIHIENNQLMTIGFVPDGTELPKPPSEKALSDPNAAESIGGGQQAPGGQEIPGGQPAPGGQPGASTPDISVGIQDPQTAPADPAVPPAGPAPSGP